MTQFRLCAIAFAALFLTACGQSDGIAMRNAPLDLGPGAEIGMISVDRNYKISDLVFAAPSNMTVSERNGYYPIADIVWRGDPVGDRKAQLAAIFATAMERGSADLTGRPVAVEIELLRFHGVTERTRFSVGGNYNIIFNLTVRDADTGTVIEPTRKIEGNLAAPGGTAAIMAEQRGQTEKVRVTDFLTILLRDELTGPAMVATL